MMEIPRLNRRNEFRQEVVKSTLGNQSKVKRWIS